jgi:hypothetical protein
MVVAVIHGLWGIGLSAGIAITPLLLARARSHRRKARALMSRSCTHPDIPVHCLSFDFASVELSFASHSFAKMFRRANTKRVIEGDTPRRRINVRWNTPSSNTNIPDNRVVVAGPGDVPKVDGLRLLADDQDIARDIPS